MPTLGSVDIIASAGPCVSRTIGTDVNPAAWLACRFRNMSRLVKGPQQAHFCVRLQPRSRPCPAILSLETLRSHVYRLTCSDPWAGADRRRTEVDGKCIRDLGGYAEAILMFHCKMKIFGYVVQQRRTRISIFPLKFDGYRFLFLFELQVVSDLIAGTKKLPRDLDSHKKSARVVFEGESRVDHVAVHRLFLKEVLLSNPLQSVVPHAPFR
ncbi:hypothetical protein B0H66DRAFT_612807 [Apodospora peruviana]|uniref:Uncharacterized protein n=1 Tax=Apodospora peruviana TaxID=516989 RepID=A0AAE0ITA3_9PEZI|nr:hypothetical protein B0H66DRAFT_612807 [Apodospora peruviana]